MHLFAYNVYSFIPVLEQCIFPEYFYCSLKTFRISNLLKFFFYFKNVSKRLMGCHCIKMPCLLFVQLSSSHVTVKDIHASPPGINLLYK